jgi:hypothetical protein
MIKLYVAAALALGLLSACRASPPAPTPGRDPDSTRTASERPARTASDSTAALSAHRSRACPGRTSASELADVIVYHLKWIGACYNVASSRCTEFATGRCERAVAHYRSQLVAARRDLDATPVPAELERANRTMRRALRTALRATRKGLRAIGYDDLVGWLAALGLHARAARQLKLAGDQLALVRP